MRGSGARQTGAERGYARNRELDGGDKTAPETRQGAVEHDRAGQEGQWPVGYEAANHVIIEKKSNFELGDMDEDFTSKGQDAIFWRAYKVLSGSQA